MMETFAEPNGTTDGGFADLLDPDVSTQALEATSGESDLQRRVTHILVIVFGLIGILTNSVCLAIIYRSSSVRGKLGNIYIVHQCIVDLIGSFFLFVTYMVGFWVRSFYGKLGEFLCTFFVSEGMIWFTLNVSTHNLVALNVERYHKIANSSSHQVRFSRKRNYIIIGAIWLLNSVYKLPANFATTKAVDGVCYFQAFWPDWELQRTFGILTFVLFCFLPLLVFVVCYVRILMLVRRNERAVSSYVPETQSSGDKFSPGQMKIIKAILLVCLGFFICWTPAHIHYLLHNLGVQISFSDSLYYSVLLLSIANCFINPFIYLANFKEFRSGLVQMASCSY